VAEDARAGRRDLPGTLCPHAPRALAHPDPAVRSEARRAVGVLLDRADALYDSGRTGYPALPPRLRLAVAVAAGLYRGIGGELRARKCDPFSGRARVPAPRKARLALGAAAALVPPAAPGRLNEAQGSANA
jgi:phytoene synthase